MPETETRGLGTIFRHQLELQSPELADLARTDWLEDEAHRLFIYADENKDGALGALTVIVATLVTKCRSLEK